MKPLAMSLAAALVCCAQTVLCQTNFFPLLVCSNATYSNATIESVTPATVTVWWSGGGERISITNLPLELQRLYHYDPQAAQEYLDAQAAKKAGQLEREKKTAEAIAAAKETFGPEKTVRVINFVTDWHVQIAVDGKMADAYIHKLPPEVKAFFQDYLQAEANAEAADGVSTNAAAKTANGNRVKRTAPQPGNTRKPTATLSATPADKRLVELQREAVARTTIIARPSAFVLAGGIRQWEFERMAEEKSK